MRRASGLAPAQFDKGLGMLRDVVKPDSTPRTSRRARQSGEPAENATPPRSEPRPDKATLLERARAVQSGGPFQGPGSRRTESPAPPAQAPAAAPPAAAPATESPAPEPSPGELLRQLLDAEKSRSAQPRAKAEPAQQDTASPSGETPRPKVGRPRKHPPEAAPTAPRRRGRPPKREVELSDSAPAPAPQGFMSADDEEALWARIFAKRTGVDDEPRRKRGRPPGSKTRAKEETPTAPLLFEEGAEHGPEPTYPPQRYRMAALSEDELHWLRPLPMPLVMPATDPSAPRASMTELWSSWAKALP